MKINIDIEINFLQWLPFHSKNQFFNRLVLFALVFVVVKGNKNAFPFFSNIPLLIFSISSQI